MQRPVDPTTPESGRAGTSSRSCTRPFPAITDEQEGAPVPSVGDGVSGIEDRDRAEALRLSHRDAELDELATRAAAGHTPSLDRLLQHVRPLVVRYCRARIGATVGMSTPDDVAQDVLLALYHALERWRPGETRVMAFVYGIASNKVVDAFRAAGRNRSVPTDILPDTADGAAGPETIAVLGTQITELRLLLEQLPEHHREVLVLRVALGLSAEETARIVGSTAGAVRVTQHRALTKLREFAAGRS
jgi:RNA polymerase sigma-70 factor, ECF subfamily